MIRLCGVVCQVWIGTKQKELEAGSMQLMHQYTPWATGLLAVLVPVFEPLGVNNPAPDTILGFPYSPASVTAIAGSAVRAPCCPSLHVLLVLSQGPAVDVRCRALLPARQKGAHRELPSGGAGRYLHMFMQNLQHTLCAHTAYSAHALYIHCLVRVTLP